MNITLTNNTEFPLNRLLNLKDLINFDNFVHFKMILLAFAIFLLGIVVIIMLANIRNNANNINNLINNTNVLREDTEKLFRNTDILRENNRRLFNNTNLLRNNQIMFMFENLCKNGDNKKIINFMLIHTNNKKVFFRMNKFLMTKHPQLNHAILTKKTL